MGKPVLLILSHAVEEYDQVRLLSGLGYDTFSLGGYIDPAHPHDPKRPALPDAPQHPELKAAVDAIGVEDNIGAAAANIPDAILDWLGDDGIIIAHHYLEARIYPQLVRLRDFLNGSPQRRLIRRTVGQSVAHNEEQAQAALDAGLRMETVRYSPREVHIPGYTGQDALIRFYKDPAEWGDWTGEDRHVLGFGQHFMQRAPWTNPQFWLDATEGLPRLLAGGGSEEYGGTGEVSPDRLKQLLRCARVYLYTGTQPASYTLGLIEAMMTGTPVVSIAPRWMQIFGDYSPLLFEGHRIAGDWYDTPADAALRLRELLSDDDAALQASRDAREIALRLFDIAMIREQWADFLG
ncbi:MAG TPA: hypothetical protein VM285_12450 [Polyangia bacterium]|nr:hypothetical protein [Polyangia bacterium]